MINIIILKLSVYICIDKKKLKYIYIFNSFFIIYLLEYKVFSALIFDSAAIFLLL